jgi:DNA repair exonuclease SbcCD ATPase subunit
MTANDTVSIALVITLINLACTLWNTYGGAKKRTKEDIEAEIERRANLQKEFVKVNFKLDEFCRKIDDLIKQNEKIEDRLNKHEQRLNLLEAKVK